MLLLLLEKEEEEEEEEEEEGFVFQRKNKALSLLCPFCVENQIVEL